MSGIAGIFYRNNRPVELEKLQAMGAALAHRGPDGIKYYCKDSVGLVHCMLHDTPESLFETLPNKTEDEKIVVTFHGRIDNRRELYEKIGWSKPLSAVTDSDLILAAYRKWRQECVNYLLGDFAFVVWDQLERKLFCARDHMGVKPFYYCLSPTVFAFSSEIKGLLALPEVPQLVNEERVADYLTSVILDRESTFYQNILRLPPGHSIEIKTKKSDLSRYHEFRPLFLQCKNNGEYEEQFREIFAEAVSVRLRSAFPVGSYLSGGLDSASIVCVAAGLLPNEIPGGRLQTFSGVFDKIIKCDERKYFLPVVERYGLTSHTLLVDEINPAVAFEKLIHDEEEPFWAPHIFMGMGLMPLIKEAGVRVLLDGHDGDAAISYGNSIFAKFAYEGKFIQLISCYRQSGVESNKRLIKLLLMLYWNIFCKSSCLWRWNDLLELIQRIDLDWKRKIRTIQRLAKATKSLPVFGQDEKVFHLKNITQPIHSYALEFFERIATREGIVSRYPFFDKRVIDFCLALPVEQKFNNGYNRNIVRRALVDVLPQEIRTRKNKTNFTPSLLHAFQENDGGWLLENIDNIKNKKFSVIEKHWLNSSVAGYLDLKKQFRQVALMDLLRVLSFSRWKEELIGGKR